MTVVGGTATAVAVRAEAPRAVLMRGEAETMRCEWELPPFVWATVEVGESIGIVRYRTDERIIAEVPITAAEAVRERPAIPFFERWRRQFWRLFAALAR